MHGYSDSRLPSGYALDLVGDPCIVILRDPEGEIVARFARDIDPEEVRQAAEEDLAEGG